MLKISNRTRVIVSGILVVVAFILAHFKIDVFKFEYFYYKEEYGFIITLPNILMVISAFIAGLPIAINAYQALKYRVVAIDFLVTIAVIGAIVIGEYFEAAAVTFLFIFGEFLEAKTIDKTRSSIKSLLDTAPKEVRILRNNQEVMVSPEEVVAGDTVIIKPGERIAVDGIITDGSAHINQATITGESIPVFKELDDYVYSGTIVESGYLVLRAEKVGEDTTFAKILQMVEEAQDRKAKSQKFLEKFSRYYTPAIIGFAIIFLIITRDLRLALTLLVVSCPGALVIATPVSIVASIGNGARNGVLVKGGESIEMIGKVSVLAFDKTGTLTEGKPQVTKIKALNMDENELLKIAAIAEAYSEHPLAKAIIAKGNEVFGSIDEVPEDTNIITGQGLSATINGKVYYLGNRKLFANHNIANEGILEYVNTEEEKGQTVIMVAEEDKVIGVISIADTIREDADVLIKNLRKQGFKKLVMLTGDNHRSAKAIATELGLDEYYADLLPEDKVRVLEELKAKYGLVAMVGDGVNDAPALAEADIGIAIGIAGADVAMEIADMVLMSDQIKYLSHAIGLSKATLRNIKQNIAFALIVSFGLLFGVIISKVGLSLGMLIHEVSVIIVLLNAVRLLAFRRKV